MYPCHWDSCPCRQVVNRNLSESHQTDPVSRQSILWLSVHQILLQLQAIHGFLKGKSNILMRIHQQVACRKRYRIVPNMRPSTNKRPPFLCLFSSSLVSYLRRFLLENSVFWWFFCIFLAYFLPFLNFNNIFIVFYTFLLNSGGILFFKWYPKKKNCLQKDRKVMIFHFNFTSARGAY